MHTPEAGVPYTCYTDDALGNESHSACLLEDGMQQKTKKTNTKATGRVMGLVKGCSGAWRHASVVMSTGYSSVGSRFNSRHPRGGLQWSVTPVSGSSALIGLGGCCMLRVQRDTQGPQAHMQTKQPCLCNM